MDDSCSYSGTLSSDDGDLVGRCNSNSSLGRASINELGGDLKEKLNIDDGDLTNDINDDDVRRKHIAESYIDDFEDGDEYDLSEEAILAKMRYINKLDEEEDESEKKLFFAQKQITILPIAASNLVSALKGSRAKEGKPDMECRVSWSSDVYDQPYTPPEHFATNNIERCTSEHKVKGVERRNKQKGGSKGDRASEGNRGKKGKDKDKDKKRGKKRGGNSSRYSGYDED